MRVVIAGAGVAGLTTALALARDGHAVTVVERERRPMPATADEAFPLGAAGRTAGAALARVSRPAAQRAPATGRPTCSTHLLAAGATEIRFTDHLPETLTDHAPRPGDDELVALACRRTTFEWVLRERALRARPASTLRARCRPRRSRRRGAVRGRGLSARGCACRDVRPSAGRRDDRRRSRRRRPRSRGRARSDGSPPPASTSPTPRLHESGIVYFSRFYRLDAGAEMPATTGPVAGDLGYLKFAVFLGDNRTFSVTFAVDSDDDELRRPLGRRRARSSRGRASCR